MSEPFDLDAVASDVEPFAFTIKGERFELPCLAALPFAQAGQFVREDDETAALQLLFGDQWERLLSLGPTVAQMQALAEAWWAYQGVSRPESSASTAS